MSLVLADRVRQTSTSTGTGTITLDGTVVGYQSFSAIGNNNTTYYTISLGAQWEVGIGTYYGGTLSRDTVIASSTGSILNLAAGTKDVFVSLPAEKLVQSVNSQIGAVVLTTTNIAEGTNEYFTQSRARTSISAGTGISYDSGTGVITNSSPSLGGDVVGPATATDNAVARFDTTTGKLIQNSTTTIDDSGVLSTSKGLIGSGANFTDYPNAQVVSTQSKISGYGHNYRIGLVGEAQGNSSDTTQWGVGVYGKGWTNGDTRCAGLEGDAGVTNSADTGTATAIRAYSKSTHSGGLNVGLTIDVTGSSVHNYALYMQNGDLFSAAAQSWELVDGSNSALRFNATGKSAIFDIITTNGAEGIATSGALGVTGTATLGALGVTGTSSLSNLSVTGTTSFDGSEGSVGQVLTSAGSGATPTWTTPTTGTVTSVTGTSPVASSGGATPAISLSSGYGDTQNPYASKTANYFLAAPNGSPGAPTFRAVVAADIPTLNQNTTGTASNVTGTVAIANGGTGATDATNARSNLSAAKSGANTDITSIALTTGTISTAPSGGTDIVNKTYADGLAAKWGT